MRKLLSLSESKGFTLIELLVVITIIAILATIGYSIFGGVTGSARDGKRRTELTQIAKAMELTKDPGTGMYGAYGNTELGNDFPQNTPTDTGYCFVGSNQTAPPTGTGTGGIPSTNGAAGATVSSDTCPNNNAVAFTGGVSPTFTPTGAGTMTAIVGNTTFTGFKSWMVCTSLEKGSTPFCIKSLTK